MPSEEEIAELEGAGYRRVPIVLHETGDVKVIGACWIKGGGDSLQYDKTLGCEVLVAVQNPAGDALKVPVASSTTPPDLTALEMPLNSAWQIRVGDPNEPPRWTWLQPEN